MTLADGGAGPGSESAPAATPPRLVRVPASRGGGGGGGSPARSSAGGGGGDTRTVSSTSSGTSLSNSRARGLAGPDGGGGAAGKAMDVTVTVLSLHGVVARECKKSSRSTPKLQKRKQGGRGRRGAAAAAHPTAAVVASFSQSVGKDGVFLTHVPSLPVTLASSCDPTRSSSAASAASSASGGASAKSGAKSSSRDHHNLLKPAVHWPSVVDVDDVDERGVAAPGSALSTLQFRRTFAREGMGLFVPQTCPINLSISRNGKMASLGKVNLIINGEEKGEASASVPVVCQSAGGRGRRMRRLGKKDVVNDDIEGKGGSGDRPAVKVSKGDPFQFGLEGDAMLRVLVHVSDPADEAVGGAEKSSVSPADADDDMEGLSAVGDDYDAHSPHSPRSPRSPGSSGSPMHSPNDDRDDDSSLEPDEDYYASNATSRRDELASLREQLLKCQETNKILEIELANARRDADEACEALGDADDVCDRLEAENETLKERLEKSEAKAAANAEALAADLAAAKREAETVPFYETRVAELLQELRERDTEAACLKDELVELWGKINSREVADALLWDKEGDNDEAKEKEGAEAAVSSAADGAAAASSISEAGTAKGGNNAFAEGGEAAPESPDRAAGGWGVRHLGARLGRVEERMRMRQREYQEEQMEKEKEKEKEREQQKDSENEEDAVQLRPKEEEADEAEGDPEPAEQQQQDGGAGEAINDEVATGQMQNEEKEDDCFKGDAVASENDNPIEGDATYRQQENWEAGKGNESSDMVSTVDPAISAAEAKPQPSPEADGVPEDGGATDGPRTDSGGPSVPKKGSEDALDTCGATEEPKVREADGVPAKDEQESGQDEAKRQEEERGLSAAKPSNEQEGTSISEDEPSESAAEQTASSPSKKTAGGWGVRRLGSRLGRMEERLRVRQQRYREQQRQKDLDRTEEELIRKLQKISEQELNEKRQSQQRKGQRGDRGYGLTSSLLDRGGEKSAPLPLETAEETEEKDAKDCYGSEKPFMINASDNGSNLASTEELSPSCAKAAVTTPEERASDDEQGGEEGGEGAEEGEVPVGTKMPVRSSYDHDLLLESIDELERNRWTSRDRADGGGDGAPASSGVGNGSPAILAEGGPNDKLEDEEPAGVKCEEVTVATDGEGGEGHLEGETNDPDDLPGEQSSVDSFATANEAEHCAKQGAVCDGGANGFEEEKKEDSSASMVDKSCDSGGSKDERGRARDSSPEVSCHRSGWGVVQLRQSLTPPKQRD